MRPRVFPAEDSTFACTCSAMTPSFNEAAGIPRGRHAPDEVRRLRIAREASMRPRVFPAEDSQHLSVFDCAFKPLQ